jgi:acyl-CoA thioesterase
LELKDIIGGTSPFAEMLGIAVTQFETGESRCELAIEPFMRNMHRSVHGGVIYSLADVGMGVALHARLARLRETCATIELKINYLKPARGDRLSCRARVLQQGKSIAVVEADIGDGDALVARALGTFTVFSARGQGGGVDRKVFSGGGGQKS